jgi:PPOX class probable F420-dependent enzyme
MGALTMTKAEREAFLADLHVAVFAVARTKGPPLVAPVWYRYVPGGEVELSFDATSEKLRLVQATGQASVCVQTEVAPYKYVTVEGPTSVGGPDDELRHFLARQYLGPEMGDLYLQATAGSDAVTVRLTPDRWRTTDYTKFG